MAIKYISELTAVNTINNNDVLVIDDGDHNYKITWAALKLLLGTVSQFQADPDTEHYAGYLKLTLANGGVLRAKASDPDKQDKLTFDNAPTEGSSNPVTSNGIKVALDDKLDTDDFVPFTGATQGALGAAGIVPAPAGVALYLSSEGAWLAPDTEPTEGSQKLITSGAVKEALDNIEIDVDAALSTLSENPVQNKVITVELNKKAMDNEVKAGTEAKKAYHLGFYLDADGDLCQA